jgi:phage/plasmid primase-like uncharacterized protein
MPLRVDRNGVQALTSQRLTCTVDCIDEDPWRAKAARRIWEAAQDARGTPVVRYLASRSITIPVPPSLRWTPRCWHQSGRYLPAMVARIDGVNGELIGVHRTYLRPDGTDKADLSPQKAMLGHAAGGAVRLAPASEVLMIAEGIETALAAMQACRLGAIAALSTSGLIALILPSTFSEIIVLADHDANGAGERAVRIAAQRWLAEGRRVRIAMPSKVGIDFADLIQTAPDAS